mmetsp:Transcript_17129/g.39548  ORF Transcript_17129/g.39548 Transcript_17129/m.39548 type:complete len:338 (-) Transcript_17129:320-1333(-)
MVAASTVLCLLAAALFWACNAIIILDMAKQVSRGGVMNKETVVELIPDDIRDEWLRKLSLRGLALSSEFLEGAFWIVFCLPIIEMAWILSRNGTRSLGCNLGIMIFALAGSWSKWFSNIFWNGMYISFIQLAKNFNLVNWLESVQAANYNIDGNDGIGWRVLEVNYIVTKGMVWIVDAVEWLSLAVIFILTFFSVVEWRKEDQSTFGAKWNALGFFLGFVAALEFILVFVGIELSKTSASVWIIYSLYSALCRLILIPLWIIILGFQLPKATSKQLESLDGGLELSVVQQQNNHSNPSNFTIDGDDEDDGADGQQPVVAPSSPPAEAFAPANSLADN